MDAELIDTTDASLERKSVLPGAGFFVPDDLERERERAELEAAAGTADAVVVADADADGLACVAAIRAVHPSAALLATSPHDLRGALETASEVTPAGVPVFVCDLCPDEIADVADPLDALGARQIRWYDHHRWPESVEAHVRQAGVDLSIGESDEVCTADVVVADLGDAVPEHLHELAAVTRDHDLWINDDPRSADLADYAHWVDAEHYVETVLEHGVDLPAEAMALLEERRVEKAALIERAVDRADRRSIGPWTVAVTYGRCSQNEVAEELRAAGADAAVIIKPSGGVSLRGSDGFERCHEVAARAEGGGHPRAAGCKPDIFEDPLDYAHHWITHGAVARRVLLDAFSEIAAETG